MRNIFVFLIALLVVGCTITSEMPEASFQERLDQLTVPETYEVYYFGESHHSGGDWYYKHMYAVRNEKVTACSGKGGHCCYKDGFYEVRDADCQYALTTSNIADALNPGNADTTAAVSKIFSDRVCYYPIKILERLGTIGNYEALVCFDENNRIVTFLSPVYASPSANSWNLEEFSLSEKIYDFITSVDKSRNRFENENPRPSKTFDKLKID